jgi:hypothetical protein
LSLFGENLQIEGVREVTICDPAEEGGVTALAKPVTCENDGLPSENEKVP